MELPRLEPLWQKYRDKGLSIIAVENNRDREGALKFIGENNLTYHFLENEEDNNVVRGTFRVNGFPSSFLIDDNGKVVFFHYGFSAGDEKKIEEEILQLLDN